jgi:hypothetical protein
MLLVPPREIPIQIEILMTSSDGFLGRKPQYGKSPLKEKRRPLKSSAEGLGPLRLLRVPELSTNGYGGNHRAFRKLKQYAVTVESSLPETSGAKVRMFVQRTIAKNVPMRIGSAKVIKKHLGSKPERVFQGISG